VSIVATSRVRLSWPAEQHVPLGGRYYVYGGIGSVGYASPLAGPLPAWPRPQTKIGFGLGSFGGGAWGVGDADGVGFGMGHFGYGPFGIGGESLSVDLAHLADGTWHFAVCGCDAAGNVETPAAVTTNIALAGQPAPPSRLRATAYSAGGGGTLSLAWTKSSDDN